MTVAKAIVFHKINKDGVTTACNITYTGNVQGKTTWRGVTCKRCLAKKKGGKK